MPVVSQTCPSEHMKCVTRRKARTHFGNLVQQTDPAPPIPSSLIEFTRCKTTISSLLLSTFSNNGSDSTGRSGTKKKNNFSPAATFRGLGCAAGATEEVSVPAVIRTSADWEGRKGRKKKKKKHNKRACSGNNNGVVVVDGGGYNGNCVVDFQDVWCGPGIGFSADASVDCVVARRNVVPSSSSRGKIDVERMTHREVFF